MSTKKPAKKQTKRHYDSWERYIRLIHKQVHPDGGISGEAMGTMEALLEDGLRQVVQTSNLLAAKSDRKTLSDRLIHASVQLCVPGELAKHAVIEGTKAVTRYTSGKGGKRATKASRSGLVLSPSRVERSMMKHSSLCRKSETAAIYLAAVLEYLAAEVLELAGNSAKDQKRQRITPRDILMGIRTDEELNKLYVNVVLPGGVIPNIHASLIPLKKKARKRTTKKKSTKKKSKKKSKK